jgi:hypothetical protein
MHVELFQICSLGLLEMLEADPETVEFGEYFKDRYANVTERWSFCYRIGLGLNTNMYLEAMHKKVKYQYMHGKTIRRIDECIDMLMRFTRDMAFERLTRKCKGNISSRMATIKDRASDQSDDDQDNHSDGTNNDNTEDPAPEDVRIINITTPSLPSDSPELKRRKIDHFLRSLRPE